ncbi:MAG: glycosyltransferase family 4 protein [Aggregatilineales bacterium]
MLKLVNTSVRDDPRVVNEGMTLTQAGYEVIVLGAARQPQGGEPVCSDLYGMRVVLMPVFSSKNPLRLLKALWRLVRGDIGTRTEAPDQRMTNAISLVFLNLWLMRLGLRWQFGVVHCHDAAPLPAAWLLARWRRAALIYDARESVPDLYTGTKGKLTAWMESLFVPRADAVITVGERLRSALARRGARQVVVIGNWKRLEDYALEDERVQAARQRLGLLPEQLVVVYLGTLDPTRAIGPLLQAVKQSDSVILLIGGRGMLEAEVRAAAAQCQRIRWLGWVNLTAVPLYTSLADVLYCCLRPHHENQKELSGGNNYYSAPNKLFEAFAAGKPIIATRGVGEIGDILEQIPAGVLLDEVTPETLQGAFHRLRNPQTREALRQQALRGQKAYNWQVAEQRLLALYSDLLARRRYEP